MPVGVEAELVEVRLVEVVVLVDKDGVEIVIIGVEVVEIEIVEVRVVEEDVVKLEVTNFAPQTPFLMAAPRVDFK